jgi:hypothetical protein
MRRECKDNGVAAGMVEGGWVEGAMGVGVGELQMRH